jgi:periplasmic copper chaperone A
MKRLVPTLAGLLALHACGGAPVESRAHVENAVITLPAVPGRPGAAYFTLRSNRPARLTGIASPGVGRIELHESTMSGAMSTMAPLRNARLSPEAPLIFAPGGRHAMLYNIAPSVRAGQRVVLTFTFDTVPPLAVEAEVRGPGEVSR